MMLELFFRGGPIFMGLLSFLLVIILLVSAIRGIPVLGSKIGQDSSLVSGVKIVKDLGLLAFVIGLLGQLIGLFSAFRALELQMVEASPSLIAAGFKVSMISSVYGLMIYAISLGIWYSLRKYSS